MKFDLMRKQSQTLFSTFIFVNSDISLIIKLTIIAFYTYVKEVHMEGTVSRILYIGLTFLFYLKRWLF